MHPFSYRRRWFRFCVLADVEDVRLGRNSVVQGRWSRHLAYRSLDTAPPRYRTDWPDTLVEEFANWAAEPEHIRRFTERYGPLNLPSKKNTRFRFDIKEWVRLQEEFRQEWRHAILRPRRVASLVRPRTELTVEPGERFEFMSDSYTYFAANLYRLLLLELRCIEQTRLRVCQRPDCENPYFVASHLKQIYCSDLCQRWGQKEAKRRWWREKGDVERRRRAGPRKGVRKR